MARILIIDDEAPIRIGLQGILEDEGHRVSQAEDGMEGVKAAVEAMKSKEPFEVIFCDVKMPRMDGIDVLEMFETKSVSAPVIMISGHGTVETAVEALKKGAFDFIGKPFDLNRILIAVRHATDREELVKETVRLSRKVRKQDAVEIVGESQAIREMVAMIETVAPTDARVMVTGPNGSGKELVARLLHERSTRAEAPFVEVNCAAIPSELIESELFGHEKGAFTSAIKQRKGRFEQAQGGTLFLDEIGDMSAAAQAKVLRALQEHKITRVGGEKGISVDVRIVAATNKDVRAEIEAGRFREDLFHRLSVIPLKVPSLNDRREDVPLLVNHFLAAICEQHGKAPLEVSAGAMRLLQNANWTGNIRELRNVMERLVILTPKGKAINEEVVDQFAHLSTS